MNIKPPIFKKELFDSVFVSDIGWTLRITKDPNTGWCAGEIYKGEKLINTIGYANSSCEHIEKKLNNVWEKIVEIEYDKVSQYIEKYGTKEEARKALKEIGVENGR